MYRQAMHTLFPNRDREGIPPAAAFTSAFLTLLSAPAVAGPPFATDDPGTADAGTWEIQIFATGESGDENKSASTGIELSYSPLDSLQLSASLPFEHEKSLDGQWRSGGGDVAVSVKQLLPLPSALGESWLLSISPTVILPTAQRGFGTGKVGWVLPAWGQYSYDVWTIYGGGGYAFNPGQGREDSTFFGIVLDRKLTDSITLGGEYFRESASEVGSGPVHRVAVGGTWQVSPQLTFLASGGTSFAYRRVDESISAYVGFLITQPAP